MKSIEDLVGRTGDGLAVIDGHLNVVYWNEGAADLLGYSPSEALGRPCHEVFQGLDERGGVLCGPECSMMTCARRGEPVHNYTMLSRRKDGKPIWIDVSTLYLPALGEYTGVIVHLFRNIDRVKREQALMGEIIALAVADRPASAPAAIDGGPAAELTQRELEVLRLLARGLTAGGIAKNLTISNTTARNHIQSILNKLDVHSQLEAVVYAQRHGLV